MVHLGFVPVLAVCNLPSEPLIGPNTQAYIGCVVTFVLFVKTYDWLRIFDSTSFYILLISETIADIGPFMILFMIALFMFSMPHLVLSYITTDAAA